MHPVVRIRALNGPIVIGSHNLFEEFVEIRNVLPPHDDGTPRTMHIGSHNRFEARTTVFAESVGDHNVFNTAASLLPGSKVGSYVAVAACRTVGPGAEVPDNTVVYGASGEVRPSEQPNTPCPDLPLLRAALEQTLPNFHKCRDTV